MATLRQRFSNAALLLFPVWGTIAVVAAIDKLPYVETILGRVVPELAFAAPVVGLLPIIKSSIAPMIDKVILGAVYYVGALFVIFFVGWVSLCQFGPCN